MLEVKTNLPLNQFRTWMLLNGKKESTISQKIKDLKRLNNIGIKLTYKSFNKYIEGLVLHQTSTSHINHTISSVRVYLHFLLANGHPFDKELARYKFLKIKTKPKSVLSLEEVESFLNLPAVGNEKKYSVWTLFFKIVAYTGMRTGEAAKLKTEDVDFGRNVFIVSDTKTNEDRLVPIPSLVAIDLKKRIAETKDYLFPAAASYITHSHWGIAFSERLKRLGIKRPNLTPYSLRHSYITEMLQTEGVNVFDVKNLVGHRRIETTENYYHLTTKRLQRVSEKHPAIIKKDPRCLLEQIGEILDSYNLIQDARFSVSKKITENSLSFNISIKYV